MKRSLMISNENINKRNLPTKCKIVAYVHYARKQMKVLMNNNCVLVIRFNVK
jgi:hypothetical protein